MSEADRARVFSDFLKEEGYSPKTDDDNDITFKVEGRSYLIMLDDEDDEFFRIVFPGFWSIETPDERLRVERAALKTTAETKVAKVFTVRDNTWATVDMFSTSADHTKSVF